MAKTAAKRAQPRMGGGGRRRSIVDCRQMELFSAPLLEPEIAPRPALNSAPAPVSYPADLFDACSDDALSAKPPGPTRIEEPPSAANDEVSDESLALAAIIDLINELWRTATGEDLSGAPPARQNTYRGKASMARVKAGQPASPSSA
jgi:hypothetical protein